MNRYRQATLRASASPVGAATSGAPLYSGLVRRFWQSMKRQSPAFWALQFYVFLEYYRPQQIYEQLSFFPWSIVTLVIACGLFLSEGRQRGRLLPTDWMLAAFTIVVLASSVAAVDSSLAFKNLDRYILWVPLYVLVSRLATTEERVLLLIAGWLLWNAKMTLSGAVSWLMCGLCYRGWGIVGTPGPFNESSDFAIEMVIVFSIGSWLTYGLWPRLSWIRRALLAAIPAAALLCVMGANTRGSLLGLAVALLTMVVSSERRWKMLGVGVVAALAVAVLLPEQSLSRFDTAGQDDTSLQRLTYWRRGVELANENPVLGIGYGNWLPVYKDRYSERGHLQHNILVQALSETGYTGLFTFLSLVLAAFIVNARTRKVLRAQQERARLLRALTRGYDAALMGFLTAGMFLTVLFYPFFWVTLSFIAATHLAALTEQRRLSTGSPAPGSGIGRGMAARRFAPA